jgi:glycosyltransferase involved in cell wall biosynthesis
VADRALHIGIDGRELQGKPTGVGRYLLSILRVWAGDDASPHRYTVFLPAEPSASLKALGERVTWSVHPTASPGTLWEQTRLAEAIKSTGPDVYFGPGYTAPLRLDPPSVVAIHDVSFFAHPEWFTPRERLRRQWATRAAAMRARRVVTVSRFSAGEIVRWLGVPRERIVVAPNAAFDVQRPDPLPARGPIALFVGSLFNRRRIPDLIRAFAAVGAQVPDARLVLIGDNRTHPRIDPRELASELGIASRVDWREYVSDADLEAAYWNARVFVFLSDYEGFAITPLEALAHDVPPVLLDTAVAREIYGDAARLVPPDPSAIALALTTLLTDDAAHADLLATGRRRLAAFSWAATAATVREAIEQAAAE